MKTHTPFRPNLQHVLVAVALAVLALGLPARASSSLPIDPSQLTTLVAVSVVGTGTVSSSPSGISCDSSGSGNCASSFTRGSQVTLTASGAPSTFFNPGTVLSAWQVSGTLSPSCQGTPVQLTCTLTL